MHGDDEPKMSHGFCFLHVGSHWPRFLSCQVDLQPDRPQVARWWVFSAGLGFPDFGDMVWLRCVNHM